MHSPSLYLTKLTLLAIVLTGCTSTSTSNTARTAKEQMLLSNAIDQSLDKVDFMPLSGQNVFIEEKYLECVDKTYVLGSVRHRVLKAGGTLPRQPTRLTLSWNFAAAVLGQTLPMRISVFPKLLCRVC